VAEYTHDDGCAVTAGHVYHGSRYPAWRNWFVYGDWCSGKMWTIPAAGPAGTPVEVTPQDHTINPSSFARDHNGELYAVDLGGSIYRLTLDGTP
jgi:glucose/arabinose dehydrogenase